MSRTSRINISEGPPGPDEAGDVRKAQSDAVEARLRLWDDTSTTWRTRSTTCTRRIERGQSSEMRDLRREKDAVAMAPPKGEKRGDRRRQLEQEDVAKALGQPRPEG